MTKVKVQQELLWMIISGYKHEKEKEKKKHYVFTYNENAYEGTDLGSSSPYMICISDFAFLPVICCQNFSCVKKEA